MSEVRYPEVEVKLSGKDGNAFAIMGRVTGALRAAGATEDEIAAYRAESMESDYANLVQVAMKWVVVS